MFDCLKEAINIRGCNRQPLIYLNSLSGITIKSLELIKTEDKDSYVDVINDIRERAANRVVFDFMGNSSVQFDRMPTVGCIGRLKEPIQLKPATVGYGGVLFDFVQSKYIVLRLTNLYFRSPSNQTVTFIVRDEVTLDILQSIDIDLVTGDNNVPLDITIFPRNRSNKLFFGYDLSQTDYYETTDNECYDGCTESCFVNMCGCEIVTGYSQGSKRSTTFGIGLSYSEECSFERFICNNIQPFLQPLLYACGIEYVNELTGSTRLNRITAMSQEQKDALLKIYERDYDKALKLALKSLNLCDNCCFSCNDNKYKTIYVYP